MKFSINYILMTIFITGCMAAAPSKMNYPANNVNSINVITCNTGNLGSSKRLDSAELANYLKSCGEYDIYFLQEVAGESAAHYLADKLDMPDHLFLKDQKRKQGIAILSRWKIKSSDHIYFTVSPRGYGAISADIEINSQTIKFVNIHLDRYDNVSIKNGDVGFNVVSMVDFMKEELFSESIRSRSIMELMEWLLPDINEKNHIIVAGDFNTVPLSKTIKLMKSKFNDTISEFKNMSKGTYIRHRAPFPVRIDYIFYTKNLLCLYSAIIEKSPGDHYPVVASFKSWEDNSD
ncbi:MAG: endonuclease/exonuclease/phosphatase family protein [Desulfamplus sp.]|nr:endonuclease/exonuclease/phosphatase family protein [Desulfamplus sp.]